MSRGSVGDGRGEVVVDQERAFPTPDTESQEATRLADSIRDDIQSQTLFTALINGLIRSHPNIRQEWNDQRETQTELYTLPLAHSFELGPAENLFG